MKTCKFIEVEHYSSLQISNICILSFLFGRLSSIVSNELDNSMLKRPPVSRVLSSDVLLEAAPAPVVKQKNNIDGIP